MKITVLEKNNIPYCFIRTKKNKLIFSYKDLLVKNDLVTTLIIKYPTGMKIEIIEDFIIKNEEWITREYKKNYQNKRLFINGEKYLYLGNEYQINTILSKHEEIIFNNKQMYIYTMNQQKEHIQQLVDSYLFTQLTLIVNELLFQNFSKMKNYLTIYPKCEIKNYKSRWGVCYPKKTLIIINQSAIHLPLELINYIVVHELVHFVYLNHSSDFHALLEKFISNEKSIRKKFSNYKTTYQ